MSEVDPTTSVIRLDDADLAALLGPAGREALDPGTRKRLADAGLVPTLDDTLRDPVVTLDVVVAGASRLEHRVWVTADHAVAVLGVQPGRHQLLVLPPSHLAAGLVRMTRLRPRRTGARLDRPWPRGDLDLLVDHDPGVRASALERAGAGFAWRLAVTWSDERREVTATDGPDGPFLADPDRDALRPVSNTAVYRTFSTALPPAALAPEAR